MALKIWRVNNNMSITHLLKNNGLGRIAMNILHAHNQEKVELYI